MEVKTNCVKGPLRKFPRDAQGRCSCERCQEAFEMARQARVGYDKMLLRIYNDVYGTNYTYEEVYS